MKENYIGYLKYSGGSVKDGLMDARKAGEALIGFDKIMRHFIAQENTLLAKVNFEIPVRTKKGSWISLIAENMGEIIVAGMILRYGDAYLMSLMKKAGTDGFFQTGIAKDINKIFKGAMSGFCWIVEISKHIGGNEKIEDLNIQKSDLEDFVILTNNKGEKLMIPKKYYELYKNFPMGILHKNIKIIDPNKTMEIGVFDDNGKLKIVSINDKEKDAFIYDNLSEILPELTHGEIVTLEGKIVRAWEDKNSITFDYEGNLINCKPEKETTISYFKDNIISHKNANIFENVRIIGVVDRITRNGIPKKISIQILGIESPDTPNNSRNLFPK